MPTSFRRSPALIALHPGRRPGPGCGRGAAEPGSDAEAAGRD